jgi:hypothetical protein
MRHTTTVILRSRALARRLEGSSLALVTHPSRLAEARDALASRGEHLRMTVVALREVAYSAAVRTSARPARTAQNLNSGIFPNGSSAGLVSRLAAASA